MIGERAPNFRLKNSRGKFVTLSELAREKNLILVFYPKDFTPGCIQQLSTLRDAYARVLRAGAEVLGINGDDAESHRRFIEAYGFPFELLVDTGLKVARAYDCVLEDSNAIRRTVVGIAKGGEIVFYQRGMPSVSDILKPIRRASKKKAIRSGAKSRTLKNL